MKIQSFTPYLLENKIQHYSWGERGKNAFIPRLLGFDGETNTPYAELWIGAHSKAPSLVILENNKIPLNEFIEAHPAEVLGKRVLKKFGPHLPFLLKVLSAAEPLSIQVHPSKAQAHLLHSSDPEHYPDENHKPEIALALSGLKALVGFKSFEETVETLRQYPEIADFIGDPAQPGISAPEKIGERRAWIRRVYVTMMQRSQKAPQDLTETLQKLDMRFERQTARRNFLEELYLQLRSKYGNDIGLLSLFLLQFLDLRPGEAFFTPAGLPHAYLRGNIIECMANSDNVVRAGLTPKFKDLATMEEIIEQKPQPAPVYRADPKAEEITYTTPAEEFQVVRLNLHPGQTKKIETRDSVTILLVIAGGLNVSWNSGGAENRVTVRRGGSLLVPAALKTIKLSAQEKTLAFAVNVP